MKLRIATLFGVVMLSVALSHADSISNTFKVSITVKESCDIRTLTATDIDFGTVTQAAQNAYNSGQLNVACTSGTSYAIALQSSRKMVNIADPTVQVPYTLFQDSNYSKVWGSDSGTGLSQIGTGETQMIKIWGKVDAQDTAVPAGQYLDTVTAIVTY